MARSPMSVACADDHRTQSPVTIVDEPCFNSGELKETPVPPAKKRGCCAASTVDGDARRPTSYIQAMEFLHTMLRVSDPDATIRFFELLGLEERRRTDHEGGRFTLIFLGVPGESAEIELTYNWPSGEGEPEAYGG